MAFGRKAKSIFHGRLRKRREVDKQRAKEGARARQDLDAASKLGAIKYTQEHYSGLSPSLTDAIANVHANPQMNMGEKLVAVRDVLMDAQQKTTDSPQSELIVKYLGMTGNEFARWREEHPNAGDRRKI